MQLCQLACDDHVLRSSEDCLDVGEGVQNAVGRFVKNVRHLTPRHLAPDELFERGLALARLGWEKAVEGELLCRKAAGNQTANCGVRTGNREDIDTGSDGRGGDLSSRVGNSWRAGIADDGDPGAPLQLRREFFRACALVVQVIAHSWRVNLKVIQQLLGLASVLAGDAVYVAQDAQGSQGDVLKIADGSGYKIQARCKRLF